MIKFMHRDIENLEIVPISNDEKKEEEIEATNKL